MTTLSDIHEFVAVAEISDFVVHEERARRVQWSEGAEPSTPITTSRMAVRRDGNELGYRFRVAFADASAEFVADIEAVYELQVENPEVSEEIVKEFAEKVAFMAVYPYVRTTIFAAAGRLGTPAPVMGIIRQGDFSTGDAMSEEEVREQFLDTHSEFDPGQ